MPSRNEDESTAHRMILSIAPEPVEVRVCHVETGPGKVATAIMRRWKPGESGPAGRCSLCSTCQAYGDICHMIVNTFIPRELAGRFSAVGAKLGTPIDANPDRIGVIGDEPARDIPLIKEAT